MVDESRITIGMAGASRILVINLKSNIGLLGISLISHTMLFLEEILLETGESFHAI